MKKEKWFGVLFFTLFIIPTAAMATPSTQIWIPSPDTQPFGTFHFGVDNYTTLFKKKDEGGRSFPTDFGITAGISDTEYIGAEIGFDLKEQSDDPLYINAKFQIKEDSVSRFFPSIAFGAYDYGTQTDVTDFNITYMLVGKTLPVFGRFSAGYYVGNKKLLVDSTGAEDNVGVLASWDRTLAEIDDRLWVAVDYMGGNNVYGALSFGLSWRFSPNISVLVGYDIFNDKEVAGEDTFTLQLDIDL